MKTRTVQTQPDELRTRPLEEVVPPKQGIEEIQQRVFRKRINGLILEETSTGWVVIVQFPDETSLRFEADSPIEITFLGHE